MKGFVIVDGMGWMGWFGGGERVVLALRTGNEAEQFGLLISKIHSTNEG